MGRQLHERLTRELSVGLVDDDHGVEAQQPIQILRGKSVSRRIIRRGKVQEFGPSGQRRFQCRHVDLEVFPPGHLDDTGVVQTAEELVHPERGRRIEERIAGGKKELRRQRQQLIGPGPEHYLL